MQLESSRPRQKPGPKPRIVPLIPCGCGCGTSIPERDRWGVPHLFANGHHTRVPLDVKVRTPVVRDPGPLACWLRIDGNPNYWQISHNGKAYGAHRVAWELADGTPIPDGLDVAHTCDHPSCTRNEPPGMYLANGKLVPCHGHLYLATDKDNNGDKVAKKRQARGATNGGAKLAEGDVLAIRRRYVPRKCGLLHLAAEYSVDRSTIFNIVTRKTWPHL